MEERLEKTQHDLHAMKSEHMCLGDFLMRLARALCWSECAEAPVHGPDTQILAETLLERAERLSLHHDHHVHHGCDKVRVSETGNIQISQQYFFLFKELYGTWWSSWSSSSSTKTTT